MRYIADIIMEQNKPKRGIVVPFLLCCAALNIVHVQGFPSGEDFRYVDYTNPATHQIANWLVSQLRPKEIIAPIELPLIPYRLPLQVKRNSEVTNAIIGSEETQKMYRDGRK